MTKNVYHVRSYKNLERSCKINIRKAMTHPFDKIFISSYTIKILEVLHVLHIEDNSELLSSSSQKATDCSTQVSEQQREMYLILSFETYKII